MSEPLSIYSEAVIAATASELRASLPLSYTSPSEPTSADVVMVAGTSGWPNRVTQHLRSGIGKIVVADPLPSSAAEINALASVADADGATVLLSEPYAGNPAVAAIAARLDGADVITITGTNSAPASATLFTQVRLIRALGIDVVAVLDVLDNGASALASVSGRRGDQSVLVRLLASSTTSESARQVVRAYGLTAVLTATVYGPETARPATIAVSTPDAGASVPTPYETAHRATLRSLRNGASSTDLRAFATDVELLTSPR